ncbi:MAG TPA: PLP-dependent aspartate aminotransferase family protein [Gammaproteobacteria bacterium]|jgi:cystathionine beta-lyase/cystathionine gamma-synthase|nr:PLP-dependent aspartate aminotransferase family protein [Gammaproteobacteria bacterium]
MTHKLKPLASCHFSTCSIHGGVEPDPTTGAILTPIYQSATYVQQSVGQHKGYTYSRSGNPTVTTLEKKLGLLEGIDSAVCFSTGMAATTALCFSLLKSGDHFICSDVVYGGTVRLIRQVLSKFDVSVSFVDTSDPAKVKSALQKNTKFIFIETPANPTLKLTDIQTIGDIAHAHHILLIVDNTFLTAALQKPFDLGADIVLYSTTKYIDGHNATVGGALLAKNPEITEQFLFIRNALGSIQSPFDAWLILQGIKTLDLRMQQHSRHAEIVANYLASHPRIKSVNYPGLKNFPQFDLGKKQQKLHGGMLTFEVKGGYHNALTVMNSVQLCSLAENLGSIETLITHPASMTHGPIPEADRHAVGIYDGLIRLSVGLENPEDILHDLDQALEKCEG